MSAFTKSEGRSILKNLVDHLVQKLGSKFVNSSSQSLSISTEDLTAEFLDSLKDEPVRESMIRLLSGDMDNYVEEKHSMWSRVFQDYIFAALKKIVQNHKIH